MADQEPRSAVREGGPVSERGRSLVGFYVALGLVAVLGGLAIWLWKPVSAQFAFHRLWTRGAYLTIWDQAKADPVRRNVYRRLLLEKAASPRLAERLEAHKLSALIERGTSAEGRLAAIEVLEQAFAREARQWLQEQRRESSVVVTVRSLEPVSSVEVTDISGTSLYRKTEQICHEVTMSAVIFLRDGEECSRAELDRLRQGLAREFGADPESGVVLAIWRAGGPAEPTKK